MVVLAVGISALMLIASLSTSIENTLAENVYDILSSDIIITPDSQSGDAMITDSDGFIERIEMYGEVEAASPRIEAEGLISTGIGWMNTSGALVLGIDQNSDHSVSDLRDYIVQGSYATFRDHNGTGLPPIILGDLFMKGSHLQVEDGDGMVETHEKVRLTFGRLRETEGDITPIVMEFFIAAVYETRLPYFDSLTVFIPIEQCRTLLDLNRYDPKANKILVRLHDRGDAPALKDDILEELEGTSGETLTGRTHKEYKEYYLNDIIETTRPVGYLIIGFSLAATILRMAHSSASAVQERVFDIGILRAIGFTKKRVMKIYLLEAGFIGTMGGAFGLGLGYLIIFLLQASSMSILGFPLNELNIYPSASFLLGLQGLAMGVGVLSVLGLLMKVLRDPSVYLIRVQ